jgi:pimeloyl-ACP methyl ester carboxylesterase
MTIAFVHGNPETPAVWDLVAARLAEAGFGDQVRLSPPGFGAAAPPGFTATPDEYRDWLIGELERLGRPVDLVGHDWGGVVAWVFAATHPEMLDRLIILNAPHPALFARQLRDNAAQQQASQYMLMFRSPTAEATLSADSYAMLRRMVLANASDDDREKYVEAWSQPGALTGGLNYYRAAGVGPPAPSTGDATPPPPAAALPAQALTVRVPTLVIWGEKDTALLPANLDGLGDVVPQLTVKRIPNGTHWIPRENAAEVNATIREYLGHPVER